jgi:Ca-activated chloride channel family protein
MKLSPDSPELTAYALGELTPAERAEVEAALAASPELRAEVESLQLTVGRLADEFATEPAVALSMAQRAAIVGQAASLPAEDTEPEITNPTRGSQRTDGRLEGGPTLWERLLAWRQQLVWAAVGACALAISFVLWPRQRDAIAEFNELRYQRLPVPAPVAAEAETVNAGAMVASAPVAEPAAKPAVAPVELAVAAKDKLESVTVTGQTTVPAAVTPTAPSLAVTVPADGRAKTSANAPKPASIPVAPARAEDLAKQPVMQMDPVLARRYGLIPANPQPTSGGLGGSLGGTKVSRQLDIAANAPAPALAPAQQSQTSTRFYAAPPALAEQPVELKRDNYAAGQRGLAETRQLERVEERLGRTTDFYRYRAPSSESYEAIIDNDFKPVASAPLSTFSLDVDTASYANVRRFLREGSLPPRDAVRLEELINYFRYDYPQPKGEHPFLASIEMTDSPWKEGHKLVRIGLQAKAVDRRERPAANLVFLLDVSGSMEPENKLPLVKRSLRLLLDKLTERDRVGIVTYAGESRIAAEPTVVNPAGKEKLLAVIEGLRAGSGTHGSAGIQSAYAMATNQFNRENVNRVILCTDGDFNIGVTDRGELLNLITERAKSGVFLSVLGYGMGNYKDGTMELLADKGNGNYAYVDSFTEARKVLSEQLEGTLVTIAKDVKVQVEFNPARVKSYRLLGYENRALKDRDFNDDTKDAGEVGAGHQITVLYEIEPAVPNLAGVDPLRYQAKQEEQELKERLKPGHGDELLNLKLRYKQTDGDTSKLIETPVKDGDREFAKATSDFKFTTAVAGYGMLLRQSPHKGDLTWDKVLRLAEQGLGEDKEGYRAEFVDLVRRAQQLGGFSEPGPRNPAAKRGVEFE